MMNLISPTLAASTALRNKIGGLLTSDNMNGYGTAKEDRSRTARTGSGGNISTPALIAEYLPAAEISLPSEDDEGCYEEPRPKEKAAIQWDILPQTDRESLDLIRTAVPQPRISPQTSKNTLTFGHAKSFAGILKKPTIRWGSDSSDDSDSEDDITLKCSFPDRARGQARNTSGGSLNSLSRLERSPPANLFYDRHISFDTFPDNEAVKGNILSYTLTSTHKKYAFHRASRVFVVGYNEKSYSINALQWMLDELVDDGDTIICVMVVEENDKLKTGLKPGEKHTEKYKKLAQETLKRIQAKNDMQKGVRIILEFAVGRRTKTFTTVLRIYMPNMLVVGTRGHSADTWKGYLKNQSSFSQWCLKSANVPTIVVKPPKKRDKIKESRAADADKEQGYQAVLNDSGATTHESLGDVGRFSFEATNAPADEARAVAKALNLPPDLFKPIEDNTKAEPVRPRAGSEPLSDVRAGSPSESRKLAPVMATDSPAISGDEESDEDEDDSSKDDKKAEADKLNKEKKRLLHDMEMKEAQDHIARARAKKIKDDEKAEKAAAAAARGDTTPAHAEDDDEDEDVVEPGTGSPELSQQDGHESDEMSQLEESDKLGALPALRTGNEGAGNQSRRYSNDSDATLKSGNFNDGDETPTNTTGHSPLGDGDETPRPTGGDENTKLKRDVKV